MNCFRFLKIRSYANYGADHFITLSKNYIKKGNNTTRTVIGYALCYRSKNGSCSLS